jgi:RNA recognition motif-containing protein
MLIVSSDYTFDKFKVLPQVKAIYVNNLPESVTQEQLKELFKCHGEITRVVLPAPKPGQSKREFRFVHFAERESALKVVEQAEKYELEGNCDRLDIDALLIFLVKGCTF